MFTVVVTVLCDQLTQPLARPNFPRALNPVDVIVSPVAVRLLHLTDVFRRNHFFFSFLRTASDVAIPANAVIPPAMRYDIS